MPYKDKADQRRACREYYRKTREHQIIRITAGKKKRAAEARKLVAEVQKDGCIDCGEKHPATLDFDHRDPSQKKFHISEAVPAGYGIKTIAEEIAKCDVRCSNCHRKRTAEFRRKTLT